MSEEIINGRVCSAELCRPLVDVKICLVDGKNKVLDKSTSDKKGNWKIAPSVDTSFVTFEAAGFCVKKYQPSDLPITVRLLENRLIGYQNELSFEPGQSVTAYVNSPVKYSAKLYRHGLIKLCIADLGMHAPSQETVPDDEIVARGLTWKPSLTYRIPTDAKPGLYSLLLEAPGHESFAIPMVVATPKSQAAKNARLLVLANTNTWKCYNLWGGRSRYRNYEGGWKKGFAGRFRILFGPREYLAQVLPVRVKDWIKWLLGRRSDSTWMSKPLTIYRPLTNCALESDSVLEPFTNHLAGGEWRLLAWLEQENIGYDLIAEKALHDSPDFLERYKAVLINTHSEYWSRNVFESIRKYHNDNGLWILNISGNTLFCEVDLLRDGSVRYVGPSFTESCAEDTQLLGVRVDLWDYSTCAPYKVINSAHWAFEGIPDLRNGCFFGQTSLNQNTKTLSPWYDAGRPGVLNGLTGQGASGWETDKLSSTAPKDIELIAKGCNLFGGADMVVREPAGDRGGMFSVSSIVFSGCLLIDDIASRVVRNIVRKALNYC